MLSVFYLPRVVVECFLVVDYIPVVFSYLPAGIVLNGNCPAICRW